MVVLGILLIVLALPLLIIYALAENKNKLQLRLGFLLGGVGVLLLFIPQ